MAFTNAQKVKIRHYLGYPNTYLEENPNLTSAIELIGNDADASALAVDILDKLDGLETKIEESFSSAGIKKVDEVEFQDGASQRNQLNSHGHRLVSQLSTLFGVRINADVFGPNGYGSNGWMWGVQHPFCFRG